MRQQGTTRSGKVPARTITAAIAMLAGIVLLGIGFFGNQQGLIYAGLAITLCGVVTMLLFGILFGHTR